MPIVAKYMKSEKSKVATDMQGCHGYKEKMLPPRGGPEPNEQ
jgi:hypothetical protein